MLKRRALDQALDAALSRERETLLKLLHERGVKERVVAAIGRVPREEFVPSDLYDLAYEDRPLAIEEGQSISQPYVVALLCQYAKARPGAKVLDVGTGSGYQAAVLAELGCEVVSIERLPALVASARSRLDECGYRKVRVVVGDGTLGLPEEAPFDAIIVAAAAPRIPAAYLPQLKRRGRVVIPVGGPDMQRVLVALKHHDDEPLLFESLPVRFVPLLGADGYQESQPEDNSQRSAGAN